MALMASSPQSFAPTSLTPGGFSNTTGDLPLFGACCMKPVDSLSSLDTQCPLDDKDENATLCGQGGHPCIAHTQTVLYLDFDDTLFPTTELMDRRQLPEWGRDVPEQVEADLAPWRETLKEFLDVACSTCGRCIVLTNAQRPWVDVCIDRFVPELRPLFAKSGGLKVVYAGEALKRSRARNSRASSCCLAGLSAWLAADDEEMDANRARAEATAGKRAGMEEESSDFYGTAGAWENILSIGDASYERDALLSLTGGSTGARRAKHIAVPSDPSLECIVESLRLLRQRLPAYAEFDGHLDLIQSADGSVSTPDGTQELQIPPTM